MPLKNGFGGLEIDSSAFGDDKPRIELMLAGLKH